MKRIFLLLPLLIVAIMCRAQKVKVSESKDVMTTGEQKTESKQFYRFEIPAAINGSNLDPAPISNVASDFTDSKLSIKVGFPFRRDPKKIEDMRVTGFAKPSFTATNGLSTLWKSGNPPVQYGLTGGISVILKHTTWEIEQGQVKKLIDDSTSSEALTWINVIAAGERANYNIFDEAAGYDNMKRERHEHTYGFYVSLNRYFYSTVPWVKLKNVIWSVGIGPARTNNYSSLDKRTLEEGQLVPNADMTRYKTVVNVTSGAIGDFRAYEGLAGFAELFIPLFKNKKYFSLYLGNRFTRYAIGDHSYIANAFSGLFFNIKDGKLEEGNRSAKDIVNFSVVMQFNQLNTRKEDNYMEKNFTVGLQASIPLRFN